MSHRRGVPTALASLVVVVVLVALASSGALFYEVEAIPLAHPDEQGFFATIWTSIFSGSDSNEKGDDDDYGDLSNSTTVASVPEETESGVEFGVVPLNTTTTTTEVVEETTKAAIVKRATHKIPESVVIPGNGSINYYRY